MQKKKVYRVKDIVEMFGVGRSTVWLYVKEKKLTPIKVSSRVTVFDAKEVHKLFGVE
jgi:predicted DNA-binding transcriptional regulator AlpA